MARLVEVDERDSGWESWDPRFRVYLFGRPGPPRCPDTGDGFAVETWDLIDGDIDDAREHARQLAGETRLWSVAAVIDDPVRGRGLLWLDGLDYNDRPRATTTAAAWRARARMQDRHLRLSDGMTRQTPRLPNGLRVIRLFPDWGRRWPLWESFSDRYTLSADDLGLSPALSRDLERWSGVWQDRPPGSEEPLPAGWQAEGDALHERLQAELDGVAEVRPEYHW